MLMGEEARVVTKALGNFLVITFDFSDSLVEIAIPMVVAPVVLKRPPRAADVPLLSQYFIITA
jgi:hypothetical protein